GYEVDDLPLPVDLDYSFASYHSKTEANGNVLKYTRSFEIKELDVPMNKMEELKKFYRVIASDERNTAGFKTKCLATILWRVTCECSYQQGQPGICVAEYECKKTQRQHGMFQRSAKVLPQRCVSSRIIGRE